MATLHRSRRAVGTSAFTHQDDNGADLHPANADHQDALHYGGELPSKATTVPIVLGPPAFGSPDIRTLGHIMHPDAEPASAPDLDTEFEEMRGNANNSGGDEETFEISEDDLRSMSKPELRKLAGEIGLTVSNKLKQSEIVDLILNSEDDVDEDENDADEDEDEDNDDNDDDADES